MLDPNSVTITKELNGNVSVLILNEKAFTLLAESYLTKMLNSVIIRGKDGSKYELFYTEVNEVISADGGTVSITDNDIFFDQLNNFFFFVNVSGGVVPSGSILSQEVIQTLNDGDNLINHNLDKTIVSFSVKDGNEFVETSGNIIDSNNFNINLSGGGPITNATISFIYLS